MILAVNYIGIAAILGAGGTFLTGLAALVAVLKVSGKVDRVEGKVEDVHKEVHPENGLSSGQSIDQLLTAQIQLVPEIHRTDRQRDHLDAMEARAASEGRTMEQSGRKEDQ